MHDSGSHYVILTMPQNPPGQLHELVCCSQDDLKLKSSLKLRLKKEQNIVRHPRGAALCASTVLQCVSIRCQLSLRGSE